MQQKVSNPKLSWWQGILLIVGIVAILMAFQFVAAALSLTFRTAYSFTVASLAFWVFGGAIALALLRRFVMAYQYTVEGVTLRIDRLYSGIRPRNAATIITRNIVAIGTPEEIEGKFPGTHPAVYTRSKAGLPVTALAYEADGRIKAIHFQPNEEMIARLQSSLDEKKKKK